MQKEISPYIIYASLESSEFQDVYFAPPINSVIPSIAYAPTVGLLFKLITGSAVALHRQRSSAALL